MREVAHPEWVRKRMRQQTIALTERDPLFPGEGIGAATMIKAAGNLRKCHLIHEDWTTQSV